MMQCFWSMTGNENTAAVRAEKAGNKERINGKHRN